MAGSNEKRYGDGGLSGSKRLAGPYYTQEVLAGILEAVKHASSLKGVGVATASALLSVLDNRVPFMSDELLLVVNGSREYTVAAYKKLLGGVGKGAESLWEGMWGKVELAGAGARVGRLQM